jgi:hypothetical protein
MRLRSASCEAINWRENACWAACARFNRRSRHFQVTTTRAGGGDAVDAAQGDVHEHHVRPVQQVLAESLRAVRALDDFGGQRRRHFRNHPAHAGIVVDNEEPHAAARHVTDMMQSVCGRKPGGKQWQPTISLWSNARSRVHFHTDRRGHEWHNAGSGPH